MSVADYLVTLAADGDAFQRLLNRITVQETSFFRDSDVFEAVASGVVPELTGPVVAWSAGCSNGQEAYSLAMVFRESGRQDWTVLGTDISTEALARARAGIYSERDLSGVSEERRSMHMRRWGTGWQFVPEIRERVRFQHHNLNDPHVPVLRGVCQLIVCRNVLIYFTPSDLLRVIGRFASAIRNDGYLVLGASESLWQLSDHFRLQRVGGAFLYRPRTAAHPSERRLSQASAAVVERRQPPTVRQLLGVGESAASAGDYSTAIAAFRRAILLDPDHPVPYFQLAVCLEKADRRDEARSALVAAHSAITRCDKTRFQAALDGFHVQELQRAIERRLGARG